jgi:hypothetical protein
MVSLNIALKGLIILAKNTVNEVSNEIEETTKATRTRNTPDNVTGIRANIHNDVFAALENAEKVSRGLERGIIVEMALRSLFSLTKDERKELYQLVLQERGQSEFSMF